MKRQTMMLIFVGIYLSATTVALAQERGVPMETRQRDDILRLLDLIGAVQGQQPVPSSFGQRSGRGANPNGSPVLNDLINGDKTIVSGPNGTFVAITGAGGAWWANNETVTRLGLTEDQRLKLEQAFERNRPGLMVSKAMLESAEAQLATLLDAEQVDRGRVALQIDKVTQARAQMESINSRMTLEMREVLTLEQWRQLQSEQAAKKSGPVYIGQPGPGGGRRGPR
jgi:Spy/CpxP family protein refolding chaperone